MEKARKWFTDTVLRDFCVEAEVTASGVTRGQRYNQVLMLHKLLYEVFLRQAWQGFHPWSEWNRQENFIHRVKKYQRKDFRKPLSNIHINTF